MNDISNLSDTIKPKSDQLNADDLLTGPTTVTITSVARAAKDQPLTIGISGDRPLMPFKPCLTMRRAMILTWGQNGLSWIGQSMTLFCDPTVTWGSSAVGGVRISHVTGIDQPKTMMLTAKRGKRAQCTLQPLVIDHSAVMAQWQGAATQEERDALWPTFTEIQRVAINNAG